MRDGTVGGPCAYGGRAVCAPASEGISGSRSEQGAAFYCGFRSISANGCDPGF